MLQNLTLCLRNFLKKLIDKKKVEYLESLEELRGYSDLTIKSYAQSLREAFLYIEVIQEDEIITFDLMSYRIKIASLNPKTISKKLSAIRGFVEFLNNNDLKVVLKADDTIKTAKTLPKPISHEKIKEAIAKATEDETLVVLLLYTLGLRISELSSLKIDDISTDWIRVLGKGNKQRDVPIIDKIKELLSRYMLKNHTNKFLFEKNGERLSDNSLRYTVNKVFKRIFLKVTPHQLRHSYATVLLNGGAPIVDVGELLGHSSMATTQIYTKLGNALKIENYSKAHPLFGAENIDK